MRMHIAVASSLPPVWISLYLLEHADPWAAALRLNIRWLLWSCVVYYTPSFLSSSSFCTNAVQVCSWSPSYSYYMGSRKFLVWLLVALDGGFLVLLSLFHHGFQDSLGRLENI